MLRHLDAQRLGAQAAASILFRPSARSTGARDRAERARADEGSRAARAPV